ncbi:type I restriction endonuclease subunit R [Corynebacterium sanguinis]|uniref:type I restriction endonuclease subunit R n=1 Tax=Corynebacterium sanguinis TaxID=2594913 RepID=UPI00223BA9DF|nr:type I restriction endonuclease subunit R [Corynebacterium sanguinis]MCT1414646.1 type I restriction endonuclease subunit R [Corynebacterium sanguinis]MDN8577527.1 type I restriction endonuclease subunit R [Corynebacterium sanguinis]
MVYSEAAFEVDALDLLGELEWNPVNGKELAPGSGERDSWREIVLRGRLLNALRNLNPDVPDEYLQQAMAEVVTAQSQSAIAENRRLHEILVEGYRGIEYYDANGKRQNPTITFFSRDPSKNDYIAANQITIRNLDKERRFDVVLYVNGMPLAIIELKQSGSTATVENAFNQLRTYVEEFPMAFRFANIVVASDGIGAIYGTPFTPREHMSTWRVNDDGEPFEQGPLVVVDGEHMTEFDMLMWGLFNVERFGQIFVDFTAFDEVDGELRMRVAKPHQYFAVTKAAGRTIQAARSDKKAGVVWHTTGSGKSMEMEMYTAKIMRDARLDSPTVIVLNDRNELDKQLFDTFSVSTLLPEDPVHISSREDLRDQLSQRQSGGIYFATLQKFGLQGTKDKRELEHPVLSERHNVVVISDEAHRSHYGFGDTNADGYAHHLRTALQNATMIAFTGTPIDEWDRNTRKVFGGEIDVYDMNRAVADGAVVPVYFEPRLIPLERIQGITDEAIDDAAAEILAGTEDEEREKAQRSVAVLNTVYGSDQRLSNLAQDFVRHWEDRRENMRQFIGAPGKAMIVVQTRDIAAKLYEKIIELRPHWHHDDDLKGKIKVIYSGAASDPSHLQKHVRNQSRMDAIKDRMKDAGDELEIAIVQGMMLTGFDAPPLHTLYLDRPLKSALLMQTLARVNRKFRQKESGLLVAYAPLIDNLQAAIAEFTKSSSTGDEKVIGQNIEEALVIVRGFVEKLNALTGEEWRKLEAIGEQRQARLQLLAKLRNPHTVDENERYPLAKEFNSTAGKLARAWALASGSPNANEYRSDVRFYSDVRNQLIKMEAADRRANGEPLSEEIITLLSQLAVDSTASSQVIDVYGEIGRELPNLQDLNIEALNLRSRDESETALLIDALRRDLLQESRNATGNNEVRAKQFSERIRELMNRYTNQQLTSAEVIAELIELSKEIVAESNRGEQFSPPLSNDELAFYDVMATNGSAGELLEDDVLAQIARELVTALRRDAKTDWTVRDDVRAKLRRSIRTLLRKHKYPPEQRNEAVVLVLEQMERFAPRWSEAA